MNTYRIVVDMTDCATDYGAVGLLAPLGIDTDAQRFGAFAPPPGWGVTILAEARSGQRAALMTPPDERAKARVEHVFEAVPGGLSPQAFQPEGTPLAAAAEAMAEDARAIAERAGGGLAGIAALVADTSARFDYGSVAPEDRWYYGQDAVPPVVCAIGNCIDINTYLMAALRAAGYEAAYFTCYYFDDDPAGIPSGMHCWVRTRHDGVTQDWDIAHYKKAGRDDVAPALNPVPGKRFALAFGRDHHFRWGGIDIQVPTPSRPVWVLEDGRVHWGEGPIVQLLQD
ncbi:MAG: transglutaminase domain-containing protein [Pseudomonadota bacterium]